MPLPEEHQPMSPEAAAQVEFDQQVSAAKYRLVFENMTEEVKNGRSLIFYGFDRDKTLFLKKEDDTRIDMPLYSALRHLGEQTYYSTELVEDKMWERVGFMYATIRRLTTENEAQSAELARRLDPDTVAAELRALLAECEPDGLDHGVRYTEAFIAWRQGIDHDRRLQGKLITESAARLGLTL